MVALIQPIHILREAEISRLESELYAAKGRIADLETLAAFDRHEKLRLLRQSAALVDEVAHLQAQHYSQPVPSRKCIPNVNLGSAHWED